MFTVLAQLSPIAGNSPSREVTPSGRGERSDGLPERPEKSVLCGRRYPEWGSYRAPRLGRVNRHRPMYRALLRSR